MKIAPRVWRNARQRDDMTYLQITSSLKLHFRTYTRTHTVCIRLFLERDYFSINRNPIKLDSYSTAQQTTRLLFFYLNIHRHSREDLRSKIKT